MKVLTITLRIEFLAQYLQFYAKKSNVYFILRVISYIPNPWRLR